MPKLLIFDAFTLLIPEKTVANYALLQCKTFSLKIWLCKIFEKYHVWPFQEVFVLSLAFMYVGIGESARLGTAACLQQLSGPWYLWHCFFIV